MSTTDLVSLDARERLAVLEVRALRLHAEGYSVRQIADSLDIGEPHIRSLLALRQPCRTEACGTPHIGRPRKGWVQVRIWRTWQFCSARCAARWLQLGRAS